MNDETVSIFEQVKAATDLEAYFGGYLKRDLRMEGNNMMACCCPWHEEKTPSLKIYLDSASFRCFGSCDFGGSIIDAVMKTENFEYPIEAVEWLNKEYKLNLQNTSAHHKAFREKVDKAKAKFTQAQTEMDDPRSSVAERARKTLEARGISEETWRAFGLSVDKEDGRLLIPIFERGGHPVAWSGRALMERMPCPECGQTVQAEDLFKARSSIHSELNHEKSPRYCKEEACVKAATTCTHCGKQSIPAAIANQFPKYKDSFGYQKNDNLYNLSQARKLLRNQKEAAEQQAILVMEGFGDVWACHQAGYVGSVAYNGGSMTTKQAKQVADLAHSLGRWVGLVPDMDVTGRSKVHKNIASLRAEDPGIDVRILHGIDKFQKPDGDGCKDAGEVLQYGGDDLLGEILKNNWYSADEFKIREIIDGDWDKIQQIEQITRVLSEARQTIQLDELVPLLAEHWGTKEGTVSTFIHNAKSKDADFTETAKIISTMEDAQLSAEKYLEEGFVISTDYEAINDCLPGGGFRLGQLSLVLGKSGTGKTTLIANLLWQFLRSQQLPCVFFSLEQPKAQVYITLTQIALGLQTKEAEELIRNRDPQLKEVNELFSQLTIVDNVPDDQQDIIPMTPDRIKQLIYEINLTRTGLGETVKVVAIDHLGLIKPDKDASQGVKDSDSAVSGYAMEKFYSTCKQTQTFFMVLQQLPKEVAPGEEFSYDAGRGASQQTDFSDYIVCIWRPDQAKGLSDDEKAAYEGQYKFKLGKNRHGANNIVAHLTFDHKRRRITTESAYGIPADFLPPTASVDLVNSPLPSNDDAPDLLSGEAGSPDDPPSWFVN